MGFRHGFDAVRIIEVSFPAFSGSSGAPVIGDHSRSVLGILVANLHRQLHPSQIVTSYDENGDVVEEVHYHVPNGLAVGAEHVLEALESATEDLA